MAEADVARLGLWGRLDGSRKEYEAGDSQPLLGGKTHAWIVARWAGSYKAGIKGSATFICRRIEVKKGVSCLNSIPHPNSVW